MDFLRKYCKQKTYGRHKSFKCNTYKKQGGGGPAFRRSDPQTVSVIPIPATTSAIMRKKLKTNYL